MIKISEICPFCKITVLGSFSLITPNLKSYFLLRFNKVHPKCLVSRVKITHSYMDSVDAYGGKIGDDHRKMVESFGRSGAALRTRSSHHLWSQLDPKEQERVLTKKLLFSFETPHILAGRWTVGYTSRRIFLQGIFGLAWMIFIDALLIYLIYSGTATSLLPFFLVGLAFSIPATFFTYVLFRPMNRILTILESQ